MMSDIIDVESRYDYSGLPVNVAKQVRSAADRIKKRLRRIASDIVQTGLDLIAVKEQLAHGEWGTWLESEFEWTQWHAIKLMRVAEKFGNFPNLDSLPIRSSALYLLAQPSVSDEAREEALEKAENGEPITVAAAKEIIAFHREPADTGPLEITEAAKRLRNAVFRIIERYPDHGKPLAPDHLRQIADELIVFLEQGHGEL
jgi:hypothetical protein